jgi:hypothetical protein
MAKQPMSANRRQKPRHKSSLDGMLYDSQGNPLGQVTLRNISETGAQVEMAKQVELPPVFLLSLTRGGGVRRLCTKVWQSAALAGLSFSPRS